MYELLQLKQAFFCYSALTNLKIKRKRISYISGHGTLGVCVPSINVVGAVLLGFVKLTRLFVGDEAKAS